MNWFYEYEGKPKGPVSEFAVLQAFKSGEITPDTRVWSKGMQDWMPFSESILSVSEPEPTPFPYPLAPDVTALITSLQSTPPPAPQFYTPLPSTNPPLRFGQLAADILLRPGPTFSMLANSGSWRTAIRFYILSGAISLLAAALALEFAPESGLLPLPAGSALSPQSSSWTDNLLVTALVFPPIFALLLLFQAIFSGVLMHGALRLCKASEMPFEVTLRQMLFVVGTNQILIALPIAASLLASLSRDPLLVTSAAELALIPAVVWTGVILLRSVTRFHGSKLPKALLASIIFLVLLGGSGMLITSFPAPKSVPAAN